MTLDIEILWHTDETRALDKAGMDYDVDRLDNRTMTFYNIDNIFPFYWDAAKPDRQYCKIMSGGDVWISPYDYESVKQMIAEARRMG